jgi:hypothetical protein
MVYSRDLLISCNSPPRGNRFGGFARRSPSPDADYRSQSSQAQFSVNQGGSLFNGVRIPASGISVTPGPVVTIGEKVIRPGDTESGRETWTDPETETQVTIEFIKGEPDVDGKISVTETIVTLIDPSGKETRSRTGSTSTTHMGGGGTFVGNVFF